MSEYLLIPPLLNPEEIQSCSPSLANQLAACSYQTAFARDNRFDRLDRTNVFQLRGNVIHEITAEGPHKLRDVPDDDFKKEFDELWEKESEVHYQRLQKDWFPASVPHFTQWPEYALAKARTRKKVKNIIQKIRNSEGERRGPAVEEWLEDPQHNLKGKPDRIETWTDGTVAVVDIKTGPHQEGIKPEQRRQLIFYAHLWRVNENQIPEKIVIENAKGDRFYEDIQESDIDDVVTEVLELRESFNKVAEGNYESLATPSKESCQYCAYRTQCNLFWKTYREDWDGWRVSIIGQIKEIDDVVVLDVVSPSDMINTEVRFKKPDDFLFDISDQIVVIDAEKTTQTEIVKIKWDSLINDTPVVTSN